MVTPAPEKSGFEKWQDGFRTAVGDAKWNAWDCEIQRTSTQRVIAGWRNISSTVIAQRYNGGGDPHYAKKLDYVLRLTRTQKALACAQ